MAAPDIGTCVSAGINGLKKDPLTHIVTSLLIGIVGGATAGLLTGPMMVGYMRMIKREDEGFKAEKAAEREAAKEQGATLKGESEQMRESSAKLAGDNTPEEHANTR